METRFTPPRRPKGPRPLNRPLAQPVPVQTLVVQPPIANDVHERAATPVVQPQEPAPLTTAQRALEAPRGSNNGVASARQNVVVAPLQLRRRGAIVHGKHAPVDRQPAADQQIANPPKPQPPLVAKPKAEQQPSPKRGSQPTSAFKRGSQPTSAFNPSSAPPPQAHKPGKTKLGPEDMVDLRMPFIDALDKRVVLQVSELVTESGNRYFMTNTMHKGAFGKVRYAIDEDGKQWAVKEFRTEDAPVKAKAKTDVSERKSVEDELAIMAELGPVDKVKVNGKLYVVMPLMDGEVEDNIAHIPRNVRRDVARDLIGQMAQGLKELHDKGYVHADVKLPNALVNRDGTIKVSDFGLVSKVQSSGWAEPCVAGTFALMAPEVLAGKRFNGTADTWSLGLSFIEAHLHWKEIPFGEKESQALADEHQRFKEWRNNHIIDADGGGQTAEFSKLSEASTDPWDKLFAKMRLADGRMAKFVLTRMLDPNPSTRAPMTEVLAFVKKYGPQSGTQEEAMVKQAWQKRLAVNPNRERALQGLRFYKDLELAGAVPKA